MWPEISGQRGGAEVPEPSVLLLAGGLAPLAWRRLRRRGEALARPSRARSAAE